MTSRHLEESRNCASLTTISFLSCLCVDNLQVDVLANEPFWMSALLAMLQGLPIFSIYQDNIKIFY